MEVSDEPLLGLASEESRALEASRSARERATTPEDFGDRLEANALLLAEAGISADELRDKVIPAFPQVIRLEPDALGETLHCLLDIFGGKEALAPALLEAPALLGLRAPGDVRPALGFLAAMSGLGEDEEAAAALAVQSPGMLLWAAKGVVRERRSAEMAGAVKAGAGAMAQGIGEMLAAKRAGRF